MKKLLKRILLVLLAVILVVAGVLAGVLLKRIQVDDCVYGDVITLPVYETVRHDYTSALCSILAGSSKCTAVACVDENGHTLVGRNLDLEVSDKPVFLYRTRQPGLYETIGLANFAWLGDDADVTAQKGIQRWYYELIPDMAADVLNSEGFYIEQNERIGEYDDDGNLIWACRGTNPASDVKVANVSLCEYLAERCATVDEAVALAREINIYSFIGVGLDTNFSFLMADATGNYGVLEIVDDKVIWLEGEPVNTNYYLDDYYGPLSRYGQGQGRQAIAYETLPDIKTSDDLMQFMIRTNYFQIVYPESCQFDCRYEYTHEVHDWTVADLEAPENQDELMRYITDLGEWADSSSHEDIVANGTYYESIYTCIADCNEKSFGIFTHEDPDNYLTWSITP